MWCGGDDDNDDDDDDTCDMLCCLFLCYCCPCCLHAIAVPAGDDDDSIDRVGHTRVSSNAALYRPLAKSGAGLYEDTTTTTTTVDLYSISGYQPVLPVGEEEEADIDGGDDATIRPQKQYIDASFDPEAEFYKRFGGKVACNLTLYKNATPLSFVSLEDVELLSAHFHPPDSKLNRAGSTSESRRLKPDNGGISIDTRIHRVLARFPSAVALEPDLEKKREMVHNYEQYKACFDMDNADDSVRACIALELARNPRNTPLERITQYNEAIIYTNDLTQKAALRVECRRYCFSCKRTTASIGASSDTTHSNASLPRDRGSNKTADLI